MSAHGTAGLDISAKTMYNNSIERFYTGVKEVCKTRGITKQEAIENGVDYSHIPFLYGFLCSQGIKKGDQLFKITNPQKWECVQFGVVKKIEYSKISGIEGYEKYWLVDVEKTEGHPIESYELFEN